MILEAALVALAGGLGAVCRFLLDSAVRARTALRFPLGTLVVNVSGSLLLGLVAGLAAGGLLPEEWRAVLGTGFLGGYTTFSAAAVEAVRLLHERRTWPAATATIGMLTAGVLAAAAGYALGSALAG